MLVTLSPFTDLYPRRLKPAATGPKPLRSLRPLRLVLERAALNQPQRASVRFGNNQNGGHIKVDDGRGPMDNRAMNPNRGLAPRG